jgi:hypothetical protein
MSVNYSIGCREMAVNTNQWERRKIEFIFIFICIGILEIGIGILVIITGNPSARAHFMGELIVLIIGMILMLLILSYIYFRIGSIYFRVTNKFDTDILFNEIKQVLQTNRMLIDERTDKYGHKSILLNQWNIRIDIFPTVGHKNENKIRLIGITKRKEAEGKNVFDLLNKLLDENRSAL